MRLQAGRAAKRLLLPVALLAGLAACASGGSGEAPPPAVMSGWTEPLTPGAPAGQQAWWRALGDPALERLIVTTVSRSPDLQSAAVKVLQAQAQAGVSRAALFPSYGAGASLNGYRLPPDLAGQLKDAPQTILIDKLSAQASWEPDFWRAHTHQLRADEADAAASAADYQAGLCSVIGQVVDAYINLALLEERLRLAQATSALQTESTRLARARHAQGESSDQDPAAARQAEGQALAQLASLASQAAQQRHALALLVGIPDDELSRLLPSGGPVLPPAPAAVGPALPRDLLRNRPDVFEAELKVRAELEKLKSAKASLYPSLSLNGSLGLSSSNLGSASLGDLFNWNMRTLQLGANLSAPLFDHGKLLNQVRGQDAALEQALQAYRKAVLSAERDVEDALAQDVAARAEFAAQTAATSAAVRNRDLASVRYREGESDRANAISADIARLSAEDQSAQAQAATLEAFVGLNRALGLGWRADGLPNALAPDVRRRMAAQAHWGRWLAPPSPRPDPASLP